MKWTCWFNRRRWERQMDAELQFHLDSQISDYVEQGMSRQEAESRARREFGGFDLAKEECRDERAFEWFNRLLRDFRYAFRSLSKSPGYTLTVILTLASGIGANTAIFSLLQGVVFAPLPYRASDRLVVVWQTNRLPRVGLSYPNFLDWQRSARSFEQMAASAEQGYDLTGPGPSEHVEGTEISAGFFSTLGVKLLLGREFSVSEDVHGGAPAVIISHRLWRERFGCKPHALGSSVIISGVDYTIVGVLPEEFRFWSESDVYTPLGQSEPIVLGVRSSHWLLCIARLKPGMSVSQAQAEMSTIQNALDHLYPEADRDLGTYVVPLKQHILGNAGELLLLLLGAVALVLLIACANVANLLLARSSARKREFAVRVALGANRARVVQQLVTESVVLSVIGGGLGLAFARWGVPLVLAIAPGSVPRTANIAVNVPVLVFAFGISMAVGILFGLAPLMSSAFDLQGSLKQGGSGLASGHHRSQKSVVILEMALTLVLLAASGLLFRTIRYLWQVNPGFNPQRIIAFKVGVSPSLTKTAASTRVAYQQLIERIRNVPGVQAADFTGVVPLTGQGGTMPFWIGSEKPVSIQEAPRLVGFLAGPDYLRTMGIPLIRGRFFTLEDTTKSPCVVAIDDVFARTYFEHSDPIGQTITMGFSPTPPCQIVGVVGHVRIQGLSEPATTIRNQLYFPLYQDPDQWVADNYRGLSVVVRTPLNIAAVMPEIKAAVYKAGGDQPVYDVSTMQAIVAASMSVQRFPMMLFGAFATLALLLAAVGVYGVFSYSVTQRVPELGIRMALGANPRDVLRMIIVEGVDLALIGVVTGTSIAVIVAQVLPSFSRLLYGIKATDPLTLAVTSLVLMSTVIVACYIPARRAANLDPMITLRNE